MMFKFFKGLGSSGNATYEAALGSSGNATYEAARQSVHKDLKIQRLQQQVDDLNEAVLKLYNENHIAVTALTAIAYTKTSGGGQASGMAFHAREVLKMIKELDK
jgi:hypothetical protein